MTTTESPRLELLPAVDVRAGRAVQLQQGVAGSGWDFGDPLEAAALGAAIGMRRGDPLPIGSVKTNIGHLDTAAGSAGLTSRAVRPLSSAVSAQGAGSVHHVAFAVEDRHFDAGPGPAARAARPGA